MPVILALRMVRQEEYFKVKTSLAYIAGSRLTSTTYGLENNEDLLHNYIKEKVA